MKIILNRGIGCFDVSDDVYKYLIEEKGWKAEKLPDKDEDFDKVNADIFVVNDEYDFVAPQIDNLNFRTNPDLVAAIETLGPKAFTELGSCPAVVDIPEDIEEPVIVSIHEGTEYIVDTKYLIS